MNRILLATLLVFAVFRSFAEMEWPWLKYMPVAQGLEFATHVTHAGDGSGRLFIVQLGGQIRVLDPSGVLRERPFLDIADRVYGRDENERGLWSVAFPPGFAQSRRFYVAYSRWPGGAFVVSRFSLLPGSFDQADTTSEQIILTNAHPGGFHYGGQLAFGPDGFLYVSCGDNQESLAAQQLDSLLGKMLRVDPESVTQGYAIPPTNPFVGQANARPEIWALGLRNPWRFSFDRLTGDLYIGDVGERTREEINFQPASAWGGANYGWPFWEGSYNPRIAGLPPRDLRFTGPATEYTRDEGVAVVGGFVYRGPARSRMDGTYFFADHISKRLWGMQRDNTNWLEQEVAPRFRFIYSFGEDEAGRLYVVSYDTLYLLEESGATAPPRFEPRGDDGLDDIDGYAYTDVIRVFSSHPGAVIRYTMDGRDPGTNDWVVPASGTVLVTNDTQLSARAWQEGYLPSDVVRSRFRLRTGTPEFDPPPGVATNGTRIAITSKTPGAVIRYSLDGRPPDLTSPIYHEPLGFDVATLRAVVRLYASAYSPGWPDSYWSFGAYYLPTVGRLEFIPPAGRITNGTPVSILSETPGAVIYYETNGAVPTVDSPVYLAPIVLNAWTPLTALAVHDDMYQRYDAAYYTLKLAESNAVTFPSGVFQFEERNGAAIITVVRYGPAAPSASVDFATGFGGNAIRGVDFVPTNGTLFFPAGSMRQSFAVTLIADNFVKPQRSVWLELSNPTNVYLGEHSSAMLIMTDDDSGGVLQFSARNYNVSEHRRVANVLINRTGGFAGNVAVRLEANSGSASPFADYTPTITNVTFAAGQKKKLVVIPLLDDLEHEANEVITVRLYDPSGGGVLGRQHAATVTLRDNDAPGVIQFSNERYRVSETNGTATLLVTRKGNLVGHVSVIVRPIGGTAKAGVDYSWIETIINFNTGETEKSVVVPILDDDLVEGNETARFRVLFPIGGARIGNPAKTMLVIEDDDDNLKR